LICLFRGVILLNPLTPSKNKVRVVNTGEESLLDPVSEEQAELAVTNKTFQVGESLETFLIRQLGERVIWVVSRKNWVD